MKSAQEVRSAQTSNAVFAWTSIVLGVAGVAIYAISLRVAPVSARQAAIEESDPYATQTAYWISILVIFVVSVALGLISRKKSNGHYLSGIGVGMGILGVLTVLASFIAFYAFR